MSEPTPSEFLYGSHSPMWMLTDWPAANMSEIADVESLRREAWELIEDFAAALDAHVASHPGDEWVEALQARWAANRGVSR